VQHSKLLYPVPRLAEGMSERPRQVQGARRTDLFSNCFQTHDADCADASVLNNTCDQSHGLITEPSARCQQDCINPVLFEEGGNFWRSLLDQCVEVRWFDVAHEAVAVSQAADDTTTHQIPHKFEREENVQSRSASLWS
jgi:hypothetical protein